MLNLASITDVIEVTTGNAVSTHASVSFMTYVLSTGIVTPGNQNSIIATAATTIICAAPASGSYIGIKSISVYNNGASNQTVTMKLLSGATTCTLCESVTLAAGYTLTYEEGAGWSVHDSGGNLLTTSATASGRYLKTTVITTGTTTFTTGPTTNTIKARGVAGGGGGGGCTSVATAMGAGGGGAGGGYFELDTAVLPNTTYTVAVGAAGLGASGAVGGVGGITTILISGVTTTANGGLGGGLCTSSGALQATLGGGAASVSTNGTVNMGGFPGQPGLCLIPGSVVGCSGGGGSGPLGNGALGVTGAAAGNTPPAGFGGGGSGALTGASAARAGGNGTPGVLIIDEYS